MRDDEVPNKTDAGRDEIQNRTLKLPNGLRSILLMVDGQRNVAQLRGVMAGLKSPDDALQQLESLGLIAVPQSLAADRAHHRLERARDRAARGRQDHPSERELRRSGRSRVRGDRQALKRKAALIRPAGTFSRRREKELSPRPLAGEGLG